MRAVDLLRRNDKLLSKRGPWEEVWQEIADYIVPNKSNIVTRRSPGSKTTIYIYDGTAIFSSQLLASNLSGTLMPSASKWFGLRLRNEDAMKVQAIRKWLDECADRMLLAYNQSNLKSEAHEALLDIVCFGTGFLYQEVKETETSGAFPGLRFRAFAPGQYVIDEDADGIVDEAHYTVEMSVRAAYDRWGDKAGRTVTANYEKNPEQAVEFVHMVFPREGGSAELGTHPKRMRYASFIVSKADRVVVREWGFHEFPFTVPRWAKTSGEMYGRGPGHIALPDVRTLNAAEELALQEWELVIHPPLQVLDDGVIGDVRLTPGALNVVSEKDAITPIVSGSRFDVDKMNRDAKRNAIRQAFWSDQLVLREGPQMTAEEARLRYELMQRLLGPTVGRLESEFLNKMIERTFGIMYRAGALPAPPAELSAFISQGDELDIEYEGPLAKAQKSHEADAIAATYAWAEAVAAGQANRGDPFTVFDNLDHDEALRTIAKIKGVPEKVVLGAEQVAQARQAKATMIAEEREAALREQEAKGLKTEAEAEEIERGPIQ